jgi:hypothetical protein
MQNLFKHAKFSEKPIFSSSSLLWKEMGALRDGIHAKINGTETETSNLPAGVLSYVVRSRSRKEAYISLVEPHHH